MRGKIRGRQYVNWQEVVRDFELICSNAMKYNQRRSRVHKQVRRGPWCGRGAALRGSGGLHCAVGLLRVCWADCCSQSVPARVPLLHAGWCA